MRAPIYEFVRAYNEGDGVRLHMPGHKGRGPLGCEGIDITEIDGADVLYDPSGIILESENNATDLFKTGHTFYSAEGSSLAIKAMLALAILNRKCDTPPTVLAARNAHKAFIHSAALLDFSVEWMYGGNDGHLCSAVVTPTEVNEALSGMKAPVAAVYITSPDYLGNIADVRGISEVCKAYGVPLLVDNAHGAYLAFLDKGEHPIAQGAAMCSDSAHKTLPVLTGGAYLHISKDYPQFLPDARRFLSLFASTSPSYLILQSLDLCNLYLAEKARDELSGTVSKVLEIKGKIAAAGFAPEETEPLKIVIKTSEYGYTGTDVSKKMREVGIEAEFSDRDYIVFMITPQNKSCELDRLANAFSTITPRAPLVKEKLKHNVRMESAASIRQATLARQELIPVSGAVGRIVGTATVSCPPAVPIAVSGERLNKDGVELLLHYGVREISVIKE